MKTTFATHSIGYSFYSKVCPMTLQLEVPDSVQLNEFELSISFAMMLFARGIISSGQGAEMVGVTRRSFLELAGKYGVSIFQYDEDELLDELDQL